MNKHTPGPWHTDGWENIVVNDQWGTTILCCPGSSTGTLDEIKANSALIAAAPAMYEALVKTMKVLCSLRDSKEEWYTLVTPELLTAWDMNKAALSQAEGKP